MRKIASMFAAVVAAVILFSPASAMAHYYDKDAALNLAMSQTRYACDSGSNFGWQCEWWPYSANSWNSSYDAHMTITSIAFRQRICLYGKWYLRTGNVLGHYGHNGYRIEADTININGAYNSGYPC